MEQFENKFPLFKQVLIKLNENRVDWLIGGSGCLFLLGGDRIPEDVDILLRDNQHDLVDKIFGIKSFVYQSSLESARNSNPENNHSIQLTSNLKITVNNEIYDFSITQEILNQSVKLGNFFLLPPEDVLLIKALLQRGSEVGKHDIEDIQKFKLIYKLNSEYLRKRIKYLHAEERIKEIL